MNVDDVWAAMQAESGGAPKKVVFRPSSKPSVAASKPVAAAVRTVAPPPVPIVADAGRPLASFPTIDELQAYYQRHINAVGDENAAVRRKALERLHTGLIETTCDEHAASLLRQLFPTLMKPLLKRFGDSMEKCRELSIDLVTLFVRHALDLSSALPYIVPTLVDRVAAGVGYDIEQHEFVKDMEAMDAKRRGRVVAESPYVQKVVEPSEELRLKLCLLLKAMVERAASVGAAALLMPYFHNFITATYTFAVDPFPDLKVVGCELVAVFAAAFPDVFKHYAVGMVKALRFGLDHRHAKVRLASLEAVNASVMSPDRAKAKGAGSAAIHDLCAFQDPNSVPVSAFYRSDARVNFFAKLSVDGNPSVRERFYRMLGDWLTSLPDRFDYENFLVPYLLSGFGEPNPELASLCYTIVDNCGKTYEKEHAEELMDRRQYGVDGDTRIDYTRPLPAPFPSRPRIGTRLYVKGNVRRILKPLLKELGDWIADTRNKAVILLCTSLVFLEEHITQDIDDIILVLMKLIHVEEAAVVAARLTGRFVDPSVYLPYLLPYIRGDALTVTVSSSDSLSCSRALSVCAAMLKESRPSLVLPHLHSIVTTLQDPTLAASKVVEVRKGLAYALEAVCGVLVGRLGAAASASFETSGRLTNVSAEVTSVLAALFIVRGCSKSDAAVAVVGGVPSDDVAQTWHRDLHVPIGERVSSALMQLTAACELSSVNALVSGRFLALVRLCTHSYPISGLWTPTTWPHVLLREVLSSAAPSVTWTAHGIIEDLVIRFFTGAPADTISSALPEMAWLLQSVWVLSEPTTDVEPGLSITLAPLLDVVFQLEQISSSTSPWCTPALKPVWLDCVEKLARSVRCCCSENAPVLELLVSRSFALLAAIEAQSAAPDIPYETRLKGVHAVAALVQVLLCAPSAGSSLQATYLYLLRRLDDANASVRLAVVSVLSALSSLATQATSGLPVQRIWSWVCDLLWVLCMRPHCDTTSDLLLAVLFEVSARASTVAQQVLTDRAWLTSTPLSLQLEGPVSTVEESRIVNDEPREALEGHLELLLALPTKKT